MLTTSVANAPIATVPHVDLLVPQKRGMGLVVPRGLIGAKVALPSCRKNPYVQGIFFSLIFFPHEKIDVSVRVPASPKSYLEQSRIFSVQTLIPALAPHSLSLIELFQVSTCQSTST